ncbi:PspC domain-containing protein [Intestinibacillus massiliensis]|uniref:PspC domain-containing protein n=1 Tax=Intestinibacillus massiliensis TaxID=1871029 RepID=UPI000B35CB83|nr:PspC domain-containing protein [Intestinibacillus massiliensis]MCB6366138.1 PspC domain-containing protein [Intestinibacillus massiliensis]
MNGKKLCRSIYDRKLCGVCGGLAEYFSLDATLIRLVWAVLTVFSWGTGLLVYIVAAIIMPEQTPE